jgi:hypothetical protein
MTAVSGLSWFVQARAGRGGQGQGGCEAAALPACWVASVVGEHPAAALVHDVAHAASAAAVLSH